VANSIRGGRASAWASQAMAIAIAAGTSSSVLAACVTETAEIDFSGNTYDYTFSSVLEGAEQDVREVVTDYEHLARINPNIVESRVVERYSPTSLKRLLRLERCILMVCFDLNFVEHVEESARVITTTIIPQESNFRDGVAEWILESLPGNRTRIHLRATQTPDFWIPPLIGPLILKRVFAHDVNETCANIQRLVALPGASS
jgi:hypothetical protein